MDKAWEGSRKKDGLTGRTGPVSQIGAGKVKHKARVGVRDRQWEEGCDRTKKDGREGVHRKADGLKMEGDALAIKENFSREGDTQ